MVTPDLLPSRFGAGVPAAAWHQIVDNLFALVARAFPTRLVVLSQLDGMRCTVRSVYDRQRRIVAGTTYPLEHTPCMHVLTSGKPLRAQDVAAMTDPPLAQSTLLGIDMRAYLGVPLHLLNGQVFGTLWLADTAPYPFEAQDAAMLQALAYLLGYELDFSVQTQRRERIQQMQAAQIDVDPLTGLVGADSFYGALVQGASYPPRAGTVHAVAVVTFVASTAAPAPASASDEALYAGLADILMRTARTTDHCSRISSNEFAMLLPDTDHDQVMH